MINQLSVKNLNKSYRGREVVSDVSIEVKSGEIVGLLGPNGAGKTTSFYMIVGLVRPDGGSVYLNQTDVTQVPMYQRAHMGLGYLPQDASIFRGLTVYDNIFAALELRADLESQDRHAECISLLEHFGLTHISDTLGQMVSGGERRRVEIARLMAINPKIILLDEPFAGIDPVTIQELKALLLKLKKEGVGILITDHNVRETLSLCDQATVVYHGTILAQGDPKKIVKDPKVLSKYLGDDMEW